MDDPKQTGISKDYKVGYKKPPLDKAVKKGEVRNPYGKNGKDNYVSILTAKWGDRNTLEKAAEKVADAVEKGESWAIQLVIDRLLGKPHQTSEVAVNANVNHEDSAKQRLLDKAVESLDAETREKVYNALEFASSDVVEGSA